MDSRHVVDTNQQCISAGPLHDEAEAEPGTDPDRMRPRRDLRMPEEIGHYRGESSTNAVHIQEKDC
jgi:hypothetical protein